MTKFTISGSFFEKQKRIFRPLQKTIGFNKKLVGGFKHVLFSPVPGEMIQLD